MQHLVAGQQDWFAAQIQEPKIARLCPLYGRAQQHLVVVAQRENASVKGPMVTMTKRQTISWVIGAVLALWYYVSCRCLHQITQAKLHLANSASEIVLMQHHTAEGFVPLGRAHRVVHPFLLTLRSYGSEDRLVRDVFDSKAFVSWTEGKNRLHVFLDSLDEGLLRIDTLAALLVLLCQSH